MCIGWHALKEIVFIFRQMEPQVIFAENNTYNEERIEGHVSRSNDTQVGFINE